MTDTRPAGRLSGLGAWLRARATALLLIGQSVVVAVALTWPAVFALERVLGGKDADTMKHVWTLWWCRVHLLREGLGLETGLLNQPQGLELWPVEPLNGLLAALLAWIPVIAAANVIAVLNLVLTGLCGGLLGWELSRSRGGALAAGLLLQSSSWSLFAIHVGVGELQHLWLLPLGCWSLLLLARTGQWRFVLATGLVLGLGTVACFYYGFYLGLALLVLGVAALFDPGRRLRRLGQLSLAALIAAVVVLPVTQAFATSYGDVFQSQYGFWEYVFVEGLNQTVVDPVSARLQPADLLLGRSEMWGQGYGDLEAYGGGKLLGIPMLALALVGLVRQPRRGWSWLVVAALGVLLALGSYLSAGGEELLYNGARLRLPFLQLNRVLAFVAEPLNFPVRFLAVSTVALVGLSALALRGLRGRWAWALLVLVPLNVVDVQLRGLLPWPLPGFTLPALDGIDALDAADGPAGGEGALLDIAGALRHDPESRVVIMSAQLGHQQPIQAVPIDRLEFHVREGRWFAEGLAFVEDIEPAYMNRGPVELGSYEADLFVLRDAGFDRVLAVSLGAREPLPPDFARAMGAIFGEPVARGETWAAYGVPVVEPGPEQAEAWRAEHAQRAREAERETLAPGPMPALGPHRPEPPGQ